MKNGGEDELKDLNERELNENHNINENASDGIDLPDNVTEDMEKKESGKQKTGFFGKKTVSKCEADKESVEKLKKENVKLLEEKAELNDKFLRLYSEFDNYKKRTNKEKLDLIETASERVIKDLLPVLDDFERAIQANEKLEDILTIKSGFELIYNKLIQLLKVYEVEEIPARGEIFNTDFHEAITHFPVENEADKGKVMEVSQKGYKIKNKVIRYSKVIVGN